RGDLPPVRMRLRGGAPLGRRVELGPKPLRATLRLPGAVRRVVLLLEAGRRTWRVAVKAAA
ncbi:MAG TPA: hypothetical protein VFZ89_16860, partial [Solirubrobacteraceae bacterium]